MQGIEDALDSLSALEIARLKDKIEKRMKTCILCGSDGAVAVACRTAGRTSRAEFSLLLCPACIQKNRLYPSEAKNQAEAQT